MKRFIPFISLILTFTLLSASCSVSPAKPPLEGISTNSDTVQNGSEPVGNDTEPDSIDTSTESVTDAPFDPDRPFIVYAAQAMEDGSYSMTAENVTMNRIPYNLSFNRQSYPTVERKYEREDKKLSMGNETLTLGYRRTNACTEPTLSAESRDFYSSDIYTDGVGRYEFYANTDIIKDIHAYDKLAIDRSLPLITEEEAADIAKTFLRENAGCVGVDDYRMTVEKDYIHGQYIFKIHFRVIKDGYTTNEAHLLYISYNGIIGNYSSSNGGTFSRYEGEIHDELITAAKKAVTRCYNLIDRGAAELLQDDRCRLVFGNDGKLYLEAVTYTNKYDETDADMNVLQHHPYTEYIYYVCLDPVEQTS